MGLGMELPVRICSACTGNCKSTSGITYTRGAGACLQSQHLADGWEVQCHPQLILSESKASLVYLKSCLKTKRMRRGGGGMWTGQAREGRRSCGQARVSATATHLQAHSASSSPEYEKAQICALFLKNKEKHLVGVGVRVRA